MKVKEFMDAIRLFNHPKYDDYELDIQQWFVPDMPNNQVTIGIHFDEPKIVIRSIKKADI